MNNSRERRPCCMPVEKDPVPVVHQQGKKTVISLSLVLHRFRMCSIVGSGNMQLKYPFSHHFFSYSMKMRAW